MKMRSQILSPSVARVLAVMCAAVFVAGAPSPASAAGVVGTGTAASCTDAALNAALAGGGLVTFNCGGAATIDISAGTGTKTITADTTIDGGGLITISGGNQVIVFSVNSEVTFAVENLTIANGNDDGLPSVTGGGISNSGTLTVTNSTVSGNRRVGIRNVGGTLTVTNSTFTGNSGGMCIETLEGTTLTVTNSTFISNSSGGIANLGGTLTVTNSTFSENIAGDFNAGIMNSAGTATVTNSTFTGNSSGGGIANGSSISSATLTVTNSTVTGNSGNGFSTSSGLSGGITSLFAQPVLIRNTIVANNTVKVGSSLVSNCGGRITDGGHNLDDGTSCGFSTAKGSLSNAEPRLDPAGLRDNGGPTQTVALCAAVGVPAGCTAASPAIDAGDEAVCAAAPVNDLDQRGFVRPGTGHTQCSIGAYEADAITPEACAGDCDGTGSVTVDGIITLVNIALGTAQPSACPHGVPSGGTVDVTLIIRAVNNALNGCKPRI